MSEFLDPGDFSARLLLEQEVETPDGNGGFTGQWTVVANLWANIRPVGASLVERADNTAADISHVITVRYRQDIRPAMRFRKAARHFLIDTLRDPDETGRWLTCQTRELV